MFFWKLKLTEKAGFYNHLYGTIYNVSTGSNQNLINTISDGQDIKYFIESNWNLFKTFKHSFKLRNDETYYRYNTETVK